MAKKTYRRTGPESRSPRPRRTRPYPDHYGALQPREPSAEHPVDIEIDHVPKIARLHRRLLAQAKRFQCEVADQRAYIRHEDQRLEYSIVRERLYFDAGYERGLQAGRQDCAAERVANEPAARKLLTDINQLTASTDLSRNRVLMLLLEAAWAMVFGVELPASPELAAIREVLWPGGNMDAVWSADTLDEVARIARQR